jgi:hypothetical protein
MGINSCMAETTLVEYSTVANEKKPSNDSKVYYYEQLCSWALEYGNGYPYNTAIKSKVKNYIF